MPCSLPAGGETPCFLPVGGRQPPASTRTGVLGGTTRHPGFCRGALESGDLHEAAPLAQAAGLNAEHLPEAEAHASRVAAWGAQSYTSKGI